MPVRLSFQVIAVQRQHVTHMVTKVFTDQGPRLLWREEGVTCLVPPFPQHSVCPRWNPALLACVVVVRELVVLVRGGKVQDPLSEPLEGSPSLLLLTELVTGHQLIPLPCHDATLALFQGHVNTVVHVATPKDIVVALKGVPLQIQRGHWRHY